MKAESRPTLDPLGQSRKVCLQDKAFSNDVLSDVYQRLIREILHESQDKLQSLDTEISELHAAIARLEDHHGKEISRVQRMKVGIAPHKNVPPEIMTKIFVCCLSTRQPRLNLPPNYEDAIWNLTQTCSRW